MTPTDWAKDNRPHREKLFELLWDMEWHCSLECNRQKYGGLRATARIHELRREGWQIEDEQIPGTQQKRYRLRSRIKGDPIPRRVKVYLNEDDARGLLAGTVSETAVTALEESLGTFTARKGLSDA